MILLVKWSDIELMVASLSLHLTDNVRLGSSVQCQILQIGNLFLGTPQWPRASQNSLKPDTLPAEFFLPSPLSQLSPDLCSVV